MTIASLFNLGGPDVIIILFIVMILFGAKKMPELGRGLGEALREFLRALDQFRAELGAGDRPLRSVKLSDLLPKLLVFLALIIFFLSLRDRLSR